MRALNLGLRLQIIVLTTPETLDKLLGRLEYIHNITIRAFRSSFSLSIMPTALIVGATRGLGLELAKQYISANYTVYGTSRSSPPKHHHPSINWIPNIDVAHETAGSHLASALKGYPLDIVIITAGYFGTEEFPNPSWDAEVKMYTTSAIGPVFLTTALHKADLLPKGSKLILVSSESGSITLRHQSEGGGNYGHHASKAATNMVGKLLSLDLKEHGVAVGILHPGFMRTEMTKGVGFDKYWDDGGGELNAFNCFLLHPHSHSCFLVFIASSPTRCAPWRCSRWLTSSPSRDT